jgi:hypothetical protein
MRPERRRQLLLAALAVALAVAVYVWWPRSADPTRASSTGRGTARTTARGAGGDTAPDVHLEALEAAHAKPAENERNLFKFKPKPPPPPVRQPDPLPPPQAVPSGPPPPPPLPPIALKFIGVLEMRNAQKIAILSDGRGAPVYGKEGETVLGQYKILRIGVESIEMAYLDGRGRQTIRLTGS